MEIVAGRSCQGCTLCCKLMGIAELEKPRGIWCTHCNPRTGCKIHGSHPAECRAFYCGYMTSADLSESWHPAKCKMVLAYDEVHLPRLSVHVDPSRANVWREEPYFSQIKRFAVAAASAHGQVIVWQGRKAIAILPDREKDLGEVKADQIFVTTEAMGPNGRVLDVVVLNADDPWFLEFKNKQKPKTT